MTYQEILKEYWGYDDFRGIQQEIINSIGAGQDTLGLMPTGGGKSICFQVPALAQEGTCIVVTPLISLMKDQVDHLRNRDIIAYAINSGMTHDEIVKVLDNCIYGHVKLLYVSPERLASPFFIEKVKHIHVSFITVDEAHCISQWGYDFRPAYLKIATLRELLPGVPVLALTATATPDVVKDIQRQLRFQQENVFRMSFKRDNISYVVRHYDDLEHELTHIINSVNGSTIVYTSSRKKTKALCKYLQDNGISATYYHAGLDIAVKDQHQQDWQNGTARVIVATNAFGMGIDKPDVRLVIHAQPPSSIEAYFQEAGRAGRDGKRSYAVLLAHRSIRATLKKRINASFPEKDEIRDIYDQVACFLEVGVGMGRDVRFLFDIDEFVMRFRHKAVTVDSALRILHNIGYIDYNTEQEDHARIKFVLRRDELYRLNNITPQEDHIILAALRVYTGTFSEYVYISERALSLASGFSEEMVTALLKSLSQKGICQYIAPRKKPTITYLINRVEGSDLQFPRYAYDDLLRNVRKQAEAMVEYVETTSVCRQRMLLKYFGEETTDADNCGHCDTCIDERKRQQKRSNAPDHVEAARKQEEEGSKIQQDILHLLSDQAEHNLRELRNMPYDNKAVMAQLRQLMAEETVIMNDYSVKLKG